MFEVELWQKKIVNGTKLADNALKTPKKSERRWSCCNVFFFLNRFTINAKIFNFICRNEFYFVYSEFVEIGSKESIKNW